MDLELIILGCNSAIPLINRNPTSQFLSIHSRQFLIDCAEGTQIRLRENGIGFGRINHILISHLHGDHFFGLTPLLSTLNLLDRSKEVHIYAPKGLKEIVNLQMKAQGSWLNYPVIFHDLDFNQKHLIFEDEKISVSSFPLKHRIPCCGFLFQEKPLPRNIISAKIKELSIPIPEVKKIKNGEDWMDENGKLHVNKNLTTNPLPSLSYAYCSDTLPIKSLFNFVEAPSILYHEATFLSLHEKRAKSTNHSTAKQAAEIANLVQAKNLIIGHFSARYTEFEEFLTEAKENFPKTYLAKERNRYTIRHKNPTTVVVDKKSV